MNDELELRVARLEREIRGLKYFGLIALTFLVSVLVFFFMDRHSQPKNVVMASSYEVIDSKGRKRATLGLTEKDEPFLSLSGSDNSGHVLISIRPEGPPFMIMGDTNTTQHLSLYGPTPRSEGGIDLTWGARHVVELFVSQDGKPRLLFKDKDEKVLWKAP